jgi:outer membrane lipoprotein-sorting protein
MKLSFKSTLLSFFLLGITSISYSQNVDEIINSYYETIGGKKWDAVNGMRMTANVDQGGMSIPVEVVGLRDGRSFTKVTFMGNTMTMAAFDGKTSWTTNFMTMEPEESTADDSENARRSAKEFPNGLVHYKNLGYSATLLGSEKVEGTDCHKIKLEKKTELIEGKELPSTEYYYLDKESNVPVMMESEINSGEMKGKISQTKFSDYQEVNGVYFPFSTTQGLKDGESQTIQFEKIEVNPTVEEGVFAFPKK